VQRTPFVRQEIRPSRPDLLVCGLLLTIAAITVARGEAPAPPAAEVAPEPGVEYMPAPRHPREKSYMKRKWGVDILFVRQTAAGHMLEFRYRVIDPEKAAPLFVRLTKPLLIHPRSGLSAGVLTPAKTGALRNSDLPLADHTYWMFFPNPGNAVRAGDEVDIRIGEFAVAGLIVQ
jgi:hypothetical protein